MVPEQPELNFDKPEEFSKGSPWSHTPWTVQVRPSTDLSWLCAPIRMDNGEVKEIVVEMYFNEDEARNRAWHWEFELNLNDFGRNIALAELTDWQRKTLLEEEGIVEEKPQITSSRAHLAYRIDRDFPFDADDPRHLHYNADNDHMRDLDSDI